MKKLVLTAITGNYDELLTPQKKSEGWDYICVTDDESLKSDFWKIVYIDPIESSVRLSRDIKIRSFHYFSDYDYILWLDGNQHITGDINEFFEKHKDAEILCTKHAERQCIYDEAKAVIRLRKDSPGVVKKQVKYLQSKHFPENYGLHELGVSLRKKTPKVLSFCNDWFGMIVNYSYRDQLSFDYVRWNYSDSSLQFKYIDRDEREKYFTRVRIHKGTPKEGVDVVYPLGRGSRWGDNELRYSIRSVVENFTDLRNIVIIGEKPRWLSNVVHIPFTDSEDKDSNITKKLMAACEDKSVGDLFVYAADDKFLLEQTSFEELDGWHYGKIQKSQTAEGWNKLNALTASVLQTHKMPINDYNKAHAFQPIEKKSFLKSMEKYYSPGLLAANLYLNTTRKFKGRNCRKFHVKIHEPLSYAEIIRKLDNARSFNIDNEALNEAMKETLQVLYPDITFYELYSNKNDPYGDYQAWLEKKDYWEGVKLIEKHTRNRNLLRFFLKKGENPRTKKKLELNLKHISRKWKK